MWLLGFELMTFGRAVDALKRWSHISSLETVVVMLVSCRMMASSVEANPML